MPKSTGKELAVQRADLQRLRSEAAELHAEALTIQKNFMVVALGALEKGWQCGKRLNEMKEILGHGNWLPYLQSQLPQISESTAQRYMKIDRDNPNAARVQDLKFDSIRKHCLSLAPAKEQIEHPGNVKFARLVSFDNIANEYNRLKQRHVDGMQLVDFDEAREELREFYQFLKWIYGDAEANSWESPPR